MFQVLRSVGAEYGDRFREYFASGRREEQIRGVHLRFDPYWIEWFFQRYPWTWRPGFDIPVPDLGELLKLRPPGWAQHCKSRGYPADANPVVWLVVVRAPEVLREIQLPAVFESSDSSFPIQYEYREPAIAMHTPGDYIGSSGPPPTRGTLGGFLEDSISKESYLVTCAHVCSTGAVYAPSARFCGRAIGTVVHSILAPVRAGPGCNSRTHQHHPPPDLDFALVKVTTGESLSYGTPSVGKPQAMSVITMNSHDHVVLYGAKSKRIEAELDSLVLYHEVLIDSKPHCFGDIFSFTPRRPWYLNTNLVKPGDSGAWVTRQSGALIMWDGMLIAGDGAHAYACFSDNILRAARIHSPNLILP